MEDIIIKILDNFDFPFMISVNILTYFIIRGVNFLYKKNISVFFKRICLLISIIIVSIIYVIIGYENKIILVNSAIASPIFYSWLLKGLLKKIGIQYKDIDKYL